MNATGFQTLANSVSEFPARAVPEGAAQLSATLRSVWSGLISGRFSVVSTSTTSESVTLRVQQRPVARAHSRAAQIFDAASCGELQKAVAIDLGLAPSSVAAMLRQVTRGMGLSCKFSRLPLAIPLLRHMICRPELVSVQLEPWPLDRAKPVLVIEMRRCDDVIAAKLSKSEYEVARQLLEGRTYRQMASSRATSVRTIANQVSSVFKKLGVSGRFEVLRSALESDDAPRAALHRLPPPQNTNARRWRGGRRRSREALAQSSN
jgi:DNA-binding NarL/FixJ family response regulator